MMTRYSMILVSLIGSSILACASGPQPSVFPNNSSASRYLSRVMDQYHNAFDVYTDADAAGNHFSYRGLMNDKNDGKALSSMNEAHTTNPHSGITCIEAKFTSKGLRWGGWYFMNGVLEGREVAPKPNWGNSSDAGFNLSDATKLTFLAMGAEGGERVEFFAFGIGRNPQTGARKEPFPDSSPKASPGYLTLSNDWREYTISLAGKDLTYIIGGFGWVASASKNNNRDITFYMDDIRYNKSHLADPRFLVSFETIQSAHQFDIIMRNVAFTYDNAIALLAFLGSGEYERARLVANALVYAQSNDRFYDDGRLRNAYQGGDLALFPGWVPYGKVGTVRMPGWYDAIETKWFEDMFQVSTHTGNVAWAILALLGYYEVDRKEKYLSAAERLGEWIERNCRDHNGPGGYTGGFEGWEPAQTKLTYKATEHNIDVYVACMRLYFITKNEKWLDRANHAKQFLLRMWDEKEGKFWTGTRGDGITINDDVIPVDIQAWAILALREDSKPYWKALDYAESHHKVGEGYDFDQDRDGIWYEGSAQMASAYLATGQIEKWRKILAELHRAQFDSGGLPAASKDCLTTGFDVTFKDRSGSLRRTPWLYYRRAHVGATGWLVLAENGINPFWME